MTAIEPEAGLPTLVELQQVNEALRQTEQITQEQLVVGSSIVRQVAGWHIAPSLEQEVEVDHDGGPVVILPTLLLNSVTSVQNITDRANPVLIEGHRFSRAGILRLSTGAPRGYGSLLVTIDHGFAKCPEALYPVIAAAGRGGGAQVLQTRTAGIYSETYRPSDAGGVGPDASLAAIISLYSIAQRV